MDDERYLTILGRQGRFRKFFGEMVSLPRVESSLEDIFVPDAADMNRAGPLYAVESAGDNQPLTLFTVRPLTIAEVQAQQKKAGLDKVWLIRDQKDIRVVPEIPMKGTGKVDYKALQKQLQDEAKAAPAAKAS